MSLDNVKRMEFAKASFENVRPGDRIRITEEFVVREVRDGVIYYDGDPETLPEGASGWEYWPTEHVERVKIVEMAK